MHEKRNFVLVIVLIAAVLWALAAWVLFKQTAVLLWPQRITSLAVLAGGGLWLLHALVFEDKLPNRMEGVLGHIYYDVDGVSFMPIVRAVGEQAELSLYYQNRFENPVEVVVHLRPPEDSFIIRPGMRDVHFAFKADGGDFGVIHQPIAVPQHLQGEVVDVELAAASFYPRSHGSRLIRDSGLPCGSLLVDWGGAALKSGVHEGSGQIELQSPVILHLSMPAGVTSEVTGRETWKQERLAAVAAST